MVMCARGLPFLLSVALLVALLVAPVGRARGEEEASTPEVGAPAPELSATTWLNTDDEESGPDTEGKVVLVEMWGTWCGPCVRSMPRIQALWERYRDRGLTVAAITREAIEPVRPFVESKGYTFPVGCDPTQACVKRYKPSGWPSTYVIGRDGNLSYVGSPYGAEAAVEKALGLESGPGPLLATLLGVLATGEDAPRRAAMERLLEKAPPRFDIAAWAGGLLGVEEDSARPRTKSDANAALDQLVKVWAEEDPTKRTQALERLHALEGEMDLHAWILGRYGKAYPLKKDELQALLDAQQYGLALDALVDRRPASSVVKIAAKDAGLVLYAAKNLDDWRALARKALMAHGYLFGDVTYDPAKNDAFWQDLSVSGMSLSSDKKKILAILIAGEQVGGDIASSYADRKLLLWSVGRELAAGDAPRVPSCEKEAAKERKRIESELDRLYKAP